MTNPAHQSRPARCDALVVGGGVTGCAVAYELAEAGLDVILVDRAELCSESSGANAGSLHLQIQHAPFLERGEAWARSYAAATTLLKTSIELWRELGDRLGQDLEVTLTGGLLLASTDEQMRDIERKVAIEREQGLDVELVSRADLGALAPYVSSEIVGGEMCTGEGKANPLVVGPALWRAAAAAGARIWPRTNVIAIDPQRHDFCARTSHGSVLARRVVDCAGTAVGAVARLVGVHGLKVGGEPIQAAVTEQLAPVIGHLVYFAGQPLTLKQTRIGSIVVGGGWPARMVGGRPTVSLDSLQRNMDVACAVAPVLSGARVLRTWCGFVNATPDWLPIIGEVPGQRGFHVAAFPYMGFTAAPAVARAIAAMVQGRRAELDVGSFAPA
jgi:glycine/D-amino acid oxidase-like deaminating enzyme